ncbi:hypothetical protein [Amycolatopsis tolypomycina]|uniref:hypothetical protein n=1 Tax=Amycolatopsis tolypomycina TaxID=208445 RepID=UPI0033BD735E
MAKAARLVPGVTTVTPHARYFAVHGLVAAEARAQGLDRERTQDLVRRAEVALAAVSFVHHGGHDSAVGRAHGTDALVSWLKGGMVPLAEASRAGRGGYVGSAWGFSAAYFGSELTIGVVLGPDRAPGPACDEPLLRRSLGELLELARCEQLRVDDLAVHDGLCICAGAGAEDGDWLASLLCGTDTRAPDTESTRRRRATIQLVARIIDTHPVRTVTGDVGDVLAFGSFLTEDQIAACSPVAGEWRGLVLRNYTVSAWRRLWAWLVNGVSELTHVDDMVAALADKFPVGTVESFLAALPPTMSAAGDPANAEVLLGAGSDGPKQDLAVLAVGAARTRELTGAALQVFAGRPDQELTPSWFAALLHEQRSSRMADFAARLVHLLVARSERVAFMKTRRNADGTLWFPGRLRSLDGGWLYRTGRERRGSVNLRLDRLGNVLVGAGVLAAGPEGLRVTERGRALLG